MGFKADSFHHQHTVAEQALNPLLVQLLEKVAAVGSNWVHAPPSRRPRTKGADKQWSLMPRLDAKGHPNRPTDLCFTVMKGEHCVRWCGAVPSAESSRALSAQRTEWSVTYPVPLVAWKEKPSWFITIISYHLLTTDQALCYEYSSH